MKAIQLHSAGGPELLRVSELAIPEPQPGHALVKIRAIGVNFIDIYHREGRYKVPLPFIPGQEAAGIVEAIGDGVSIVQKGDRVGWSGILGAYSEYAAIPADRLVPIPEGVDFKLAAAVLLQGMTAHYLAYSTFPLKEGDRALIHAAAGGVGLLLTQMASKIGARTIATVSTPQKAELAREAGADDVILYSEADFVAETKRLTDGGGVDVVYDSVGRSTFEGSMNCLRPRGMLVLYGGSSGAVPPFDPIQLSTKGSLFLTRPALPHYVQTREELLSRAESVLHWVRDGKLKVRMEHVYSLDEAERAHRELASRSTTGKLLLIP